MTERMEQNMTEQKLSRNELILLEALVNPDSRRKTVVEICKICHISRTTYYRLLGNHEFFEVYQQLSVDIIKHKMAPLANALVREAVRGSAPHLRIALEIAGIYTPSGKGKKEPEQSTETYEQRLRRLNLIGPNKITPKQAMEKLLLEWAGKEGYKVVKPGQEKQQGG
jgi:hypothetical protein